MKHYSVIIGLIAILAWSCNQKSSNEAAVTTPQVSEKKVVTKIEPTKPEQTEVWEPIPPKVFVNANGVPSDAIVLFNGDNFDHWVMSNDSSAVKWTLNPDKSMTVKDKTGDIQTKQNFGSVQLHLEWKSKTNPTATNQNRSNSGVFFQNRYEVQILDNNNNPTYVNGQVASVYKQSIPLAMASHPTGEWNTYDIVFNAPQFDSKGKKTKPGSVTVLHNGVLVQNHYVLKGTTEYIGWPKNTPHGKAPIKLQDHNDASGVSFRNVWVRPLD